MSFSDWISGTFYNDVDLLPVYILTCLVGLFILAAAIFFHEFGHWLWFKLVKKKNIKIRFIKDKLFSWHWEAGVQEDYNTLTKPEYNNMVIMGIATGILPIVIAGFYWFGFLLMAIPYLAGIWNDLKEIS